MIGIVSAPSGTWIVLSLNALGRSAANDAMNVSGFARRPVVKIVLPAASVVGSPRPAAWTSTLKPGGNTTVTLPPVAPSLPRPQALNVTRLVPIRVGRVGAPPGSGMSKARLNVRVAPAASCFPKSIRSRL